MHSHLWRSCASSLAALLFTASASADVLVVSQTAGPGVDATTVQDAVDLAVDGDTLLVRDGVYLAFVVQGKSLQIVADGPTVRVVHPLRFNANAPTIVVRDLASSQQLIVRGLLVEYGIEIDNCSGTVWFDQVRVQTPVIVAPCGPASIPAARVTDSNRVLFTACSLEGENGSSSGWSGASPGHGALLQDAVVDFQECTLLGGTGANSPWNGMQTGAAGLFLQNSEATLIGSTLAGGPGALEGSLGGPLCSGAHADGGPGIHFSGPGSSIRSAASTATGGIADLEPFCPGQTGPAGPAILGNGTVVPLSGFARFLHVESPVRGGQTTRFEAYGQPGEVPLVLVSEPGIPTLLSAYSGTLVVQLPPADILMLPSVPTTGPATLDVPVPPIGTLLGSLTYATQVVLLDATGRPWLGSSATLTLLDASF